MNAMTYIKQLSPSYYITQQGTKCLLDKVPKFTNRIVCQKSGTYLKGSVIVEISTR